MAICYEVLEKRNNDVNNNVVVIVLFILLLFCLFIPSKNYLFLEHVNLIDLSKGRTYDIDENS